MRVATYNMENLFTRPAAMNEEKHSAKDRKAFLKDHAALNALIEQATYTAATKKKLVTLLTRWNFHKKSGQGKGILVFRKIRGRLFKVDKQTKLPVIVATGRADWVGWFDLVRDDVNWTAVSNTARVVADVAADVLVAVEVEDRPTLQRFNDLVLAVEQPGQEYPYNTLIDGNDQRGIDIGLFSRLPVLGTRTNVDVANKGWPVFSRDCPEYSVELPSGDLLVILGGHFKSKGYGNKKASDARRLKQAQVTKKIYRRALEQTPYVMVAGDLNDTPKSDAIKKGLLGGLKSAERLRYVMSHPSYPEKKEKPGTRGSCNIEKSQKLDYLFLSPALWPLVQAVGVERRGIYAPVAGNPYPTVKSKREQASDHAAVWVDLGL